MVNKNFDDTLLKVLEKEVERERWRKKIRIKGFIINKKVTKKGSFMFTVKTKNYEYDIVVPQHRRTEFEIAKTINRGDVIKAIGDKQATGIVFCDRIKKLVKSNVKEKQIKLISPNEI